jgi:hypothetical protein
VGLVVVMVQAIFLLRGGPFPRSFGFAFRCVRISDEGDNWEWGKEND